MSSPLELPPRSVPVSSFSRSAAPPEEKGAASGAAALVEEDEDGFMEPDTNDGVDARQHFKQEEEAAPTHAAMVETAPAEEEGEKEEEGPTMPVAAAPALAVVRALVAVPMSVAASEITAEVAAAEAAKGPAPVMEEAAVEEEGAEKEEPAVPAAVAAPAAPAVVAPAAMPALPTSDTPMADAEAPLGQEQRQQQEQQQMMGPMDVSTAAGPEQDDDRHAPPCVAPAAAAAADLVAVPVTAPSVCNPLAATRVVVAGTFPGEDAASCKAVLPPPLLPAATITTAPPPLPLQPAPAEVEGATDSRKVEVPLSLLLAHSAEAPAGIWTNGPVGPGVDAATTTAGMSLALYHTALGHGYMAAAPAAAVETAAKAAEAAAVGAAPPAPTAAMADNVGQGQVEEGKGGQGAGYACMQGE